MNECPGNKKNIHTYMHARGGEYRISMPGLFANGGKTNDTSAGQRFRRKRVLIIKGRIMPCIMQHVEKKKKEEKKDCIHGHAMLVVTGDGMIKQRTLFPNGRSGEKPPHPCAYGHAE